jgi:amino acid transporter
MIKIAACTGFIIFGIIVNCGGVPTDNRGYIGTRYWQEPEQAFRNGFKGFCSVFVTASFAFGGTELTGLAAAEAADPRKQIPKATKQVFWRITFFYVVNLFILGLIIPSSSDVLLDSSGANTKASPFVLAIVMAGVKGLPSVFNAVITMAVISVANSATYASTRTIQAMAANGMAPKFLAYVDGKGRPIPTIILQLLFGLLAFINEASETGGVIFNWLLALSGIANFFVYGSICVAHIRFRQAWKYHGHDVSEIPYRSQFGVIGSYVCVVMNVLCLIAQFYTALWVCVPFSLLIHIRFPSFLFDRFLLTSCSPSVVSPLLKASSVLILLSRSSSSSTACGKRIPGGNTQVIVAFTSRSRKSTSLRECDMNNFPFRELVCLKKCAGVVSRDWSKRRRRVRWDM